MTYTGRFITEETGDIGNQVRGGMQVDSQRIGDTPALTKQMSQAYEHAPAA